MCVVFIASITPLSWGQGLAQQGPLEGRDDPTATKLPQTAGLHGEILVKGAWSSASGSLAPVPEGGQVDNRVFRNPYFGITYTLPADWIETYKGPPPSDSGQYVLAQLGPAETFKGPARGSVLITAQDMFFTASPARNAKELIDYMQATLQSDYRVEVPPTEVQVAHRCFTFFKYWSPIAQLHWYVLATQIRCHTLQIVLTSRDTHVLDSLMRDLNSMRLPDEVSPRGTAGGGAFPVCVADYARDENILARVDPVFAAHRSNPVPVRIVIDTGGAVKHIHLLSAFPDQAKAVTDALRQWKFRPYRQNGQPLEIETGILFGTTPHLRGANN